jgi:hypothetical protein
VTENETVRDDCAFCGRERVAPKDDNHAPECSYWSIGPGSLVKDEDLPEWLKDELDRRHKMGEFPDWKRP